ncbi:MAG: alcohol dehydrogenase, partial [Betaproteobacteria bacterium]|nr:alcohol dehydrogenase [Betaproteobacteria bacterium]
ALTQGKGVDLVMEHIGGEVFTQSLASLKTDGKIITVGAHAGELVPLDIIPFFRRQLQLIGSRNANFAEINEVMDLVAQGRFKPVIHAAMPLSQAAQAHRIVGSRNVFGKVVLLP